MMTRLSFPHITLALLTRNRPEHLRRALDAALSGRERPDDIVVSDDSDDALREETEELVRGYGSVRYVRGPRRGLGANENHLVANLAPETDWVVFNGDDTRLADDFIAELRRSIRLHAPSRRIPSGVEVRNGTLVRPNRLSFLGFQSRPYESYEPGRDLETVVVQATAFPHDALRTVSWLEVSPYGYDEVDMAHKLRRLGWRFVFEPSICLAHDQADEGRDTYPRPTQIARFYFRLRSFSVYSRRPFHLVAYVLVAPAHLFAAHVKRRQWSAAKEVPSITATALRAWRRSLSGDWRRA
jgi:GT2 family glycosyltransferase